MAKKHLKRYSTSLVIREMQIKIMRYYFTPTRMSTEKKTKAKQKITGVGKDVEKLEPSYIAGRKCKTV